jgi:hypothetical protein
MRLAILMLIWGTTPLAWNVLENIQNFVHTQFATNRFCTRSMHMSSRELVEKYRALVSSIDDKGDISILVLEVMESRPERLSDHKKLFQGSTEAGCWYTLFPHYIAFSVSVGDELLLETYRRDGSPKQEWEGRVLSSGVEFAAATETVKSLRQTLKLAKEVRKRLWRERRKASTPGTGQQSHFDPA